MLSSQSLTSLRFCNSSSNRSFTNLTPSGLKYHSDANVRAFSFKYWYVADGGYMLEITRLGGRGAMTEIRGSVTDVEVFLL
jgi:hypothetical protein